MFDKFIDKNKEKHFLISTWDLPTMNKSFTYRNIYSPVSHLPKPSQPTIENLNLNPNMDKQLHPL